MSSEQSTETKQAQNYAGLTCPSHGTLLCWRGETCWDDDDQCGCDELYSCPDCDEELDWWVRPCPAHGDQARWANLRVLSEPKDRCS